MAISSRTIWKSVLVVVALGGLFLLYPREVVLVPEITIRVVDNKGQAVTNGEVCRTYNHYLGDGWKTTLLQTDSNGVAKFYTVKRRVPRLIQSLKVVLSPLGHYYPGLAVSLKARDPKNHYVWQRVDARSDDCCPNEIIIEPHDRKGEADDSYFCTFGETTPNE